jgi:hypothetical protein
MDKSSFAGLCIALGGILLGLLLEGGKFGQVLQPTAALIVEGQRLSAAGYAQFHPLSSNDTPEGRARNRRVDIVVLNPAAHDPFPPAAPDADTPATRPTDILNHVPMYVPQ